MQRTMRLLAALCLVDSVTPWAPHAAQRWARHSARSANPQDVETARSADIVAVAESFGIDVNSRNKACCPFHDERTPSFTLNPDKGLYKCFGCGAGGDVIKLYRELANATFAEAVSPRDVDNLFIAVDTRSRTPSRLGTAGTASPVLASGNRTKDPVRSRLHEGACAAVAGAY